MADKEYKVRLTASDETVAAFQSAKRNVEEMSAPVKALHGLMEAVGAVSLVEFVKSGFEAVSQLHDLAIKADASAESLSAMRLSAKQTGTSMDEVASSIAKLNASIGEARVKGGAKADLLKTMGIDTSAGRDAGEMFFDLSKKLTDMTDKQAADYVSKQLLGKAYAELKPFMAQLAEQGALNVEVTTKQADEAHKLDDRFTAMMHTLSLLAQKAAIELAPSIIDVTTAMVQAEKESGALTAIWVAMGGAAAHILGVDDASKVKQRIDELTQSLSVAQKQLDSGSLKPNGTGHSFFSFLVPDIQLGAQAVNALRENIAAMKAELLGLRSGQDNASAPAAKGEDTSGAVLAMKARKEAAEAAQASLDKLLASSKRFDEEANASHDDAFIKWLNKWKEYEGELTAAGAAGTAARKLHEASYTVVVNAENKKRLDDAAAAAAKDAAIKAVHLASELSQENEYFAKLQAMADGEGKTADAREQKRFERDIIEFQKRYEQAKSDHQLSLAEEKAFQDALDNIHHLHYENQMHDEDSVANFSKLLRAKDYEDAMNMGARMTSGLATHSRAMFELNKMASLSSATISGYRMIQNAATDGSEWGGYWGGIAEGALAAVFVAANLAEINSTSFGGGGSVSSSGGGGGVPSLATTPGIPVSVQNRTPPPAAVAALPTQTFNLTIVGAKSDPSIAANYNWFVNDVLPLAKQAKANGHLVDFNVIMS